MKAYKGFNPDMTCRGFQYEEGKTYTTDEANLCKSGFHACENPLDCFRYYEPNEAVFHEVELDDVSAEKDEDTKRVAKKIKIGARLSVADICKAHFEYVKEHTTTKRQGKDKANLVGEDWSSLSAQDRSSLSAQDWSSLSAQDWSSLSAQDESSLSAQDGSSLSARNVSSLSARNWSSLSAQDGSSLSAGKDSILAAFNSKAKAGLGSVIALANREWKEDGYVITDFAAAVVDGVNAKPDVWYKCEGGRLVEVTE